MQINEAEQLGQLIRDTRRTQQLTQTELAVQAGVGKRFIIDLEAGKSTSQIGKILLVLGMLGLEMHVGVKQTRQRII